MEEALALYTEAVMKLSAAHGEIVHLDEGAEQASVASKAIFEAEAITEKARKIAEGKA